MTCRHSPGSFKGVYKDKNKLIGVESNLPCKSWKCPDCAPGKITQLKKRISRGAIAAYQENRNHVKFATWTCPGREFREMFTPAEALDMMSIAFHQVMTLLRRKYGYFDYLKVVEKHKDGYPHFHVLLVGKNIAPKEILTTIEDLWRFRYGLGFVKINVVHDIKHGVNYILKYLVKGMSSIRKYARVFSSSRNALMPSQIKKVPWLETKFYFGRSGIDGVVEVDITHVAEYQNIAYSLVALTPPVTSQ